MPHDSLVSSGLWQFFRLSLFFMTFTVLRRTGQVSCNVDCLPIWVYLVLFSWLYWGHGFLSGLLVTSYQGLHDIQITSLVMLTSSLVKVGFARFLHTVKLLFFPFHTLFLGRKSLSPAYSQGWRAGIKLRILKGVSTLIKWNSSVKICLFFLFICIFIHSFVYISMDSWILILHFGL